jgi:hypothetical protein
MVIRATFHETSETLEMASFSSMSMAPLLGYAVVEKLTKTNYSLWKVQVLHILRGAQLQGYLDGSTVAPDKKISIKPTRDKTEVTQVVNPKYVQWSALEQQVLGFLLTSMTKDVMAQVASCSTPKEVWTLLEQTYTSRSKVRVVNTRMALATTQKGSMTISEYIAKMKSLADEIASTGKTLEDEELVSYIMAGLDFDHNPIVSTMVARVERISVGELYAQLLSFEARWELTQGGQEASVNAARWGRGGGPGPNNRGRGRGWSSCKEKGETGSLAKFVEK